VHLAFLWPCAWAPWPGQRCGRRSGGWPLDRVTTILCLARRARSGRGSVAGSGRRSLPARARRRLSTARCSRRSRKCSRGCCQPRTGGASATRRGLWRDRPTNPPAARGRGVLAYDDGASGAPLIAGRDSVLRGRRQSVCRRWCAGPRRRGGRGRYVRRRGRPLRFRAMTRAG
jgi:hypothetical protein